MAAYGPGEWQVIVRLMGSLWSGHGNKANPSAKFELILGFAILLFGKTTNKND